MEGNAVLFSGFGFILLMAVSISFIVFWWASNDG